MTNPGKQKTGARSELAPMMVFLSAASFLDAADRQHQWLKQRGKDLTRIDLMPVYFLYGQGIELMLKAFLRTRGFTDRELATKPYGHDVLALYRTCREQGLWDDVDGTGMAGILAAYYSGAEWHITFRYVSDFRKEFPTFEAVGVFARILLQAIKPVCEGMEPLKAAMLMMQEMEVVSEDMSIYSDEGVLY